MAYYKLIQSGNQKELYSYEKSPRPRNPPSKTELETRRIKKRYRAGAPRSLESLNRARKSFRRLVTANLVGELPPVLFTFTMLEVLPYAASGIRLTKFFDRLRRKLGHDFRYIAVPEWQSRGALHYHCLVWGFPHEKASTESETRFVQRTWLWGFCDCVVTDGHPKLMGYLTKYMSKAMQDVRLSGKKAYSASHNILRPVSFSFQDSLGMVMENIIGVDNSPLQNRDFNTEWMGRANYKLYKD